MQKVDIRIFKVPHGTLGTHPKGLRTPFIPQGDLSESRTNQNLPELASPERAP